MDKYLQILGFVVAGIVLLWLGYTLLIGRFSPFFPGWFPWKKDKWKDKHTGAPGDPQVCPLCSMKLINGEQVKTVVFPPVGEATDRMMYIKGCHSCLENGVPRRCPVCKKKLGLEDFLVARMFERTRSKNHIHVLGCNHCRKVSDKQ